VKHGLVDKAAFDEALERLFQRHAVGGTLRFDYDATAVSFDPIHASDDTA
jgi:hypothetical protein